MSRGHTTVTEGYEVQASMDGWPKGNATIYNLTPNSEVSVFSRSNITKNPAWANRKLNPNAYVPPTNYSHSRTSVSVAEGIQFSFAGLPLTSSGTIGPIFGLGLTDTALPSIGSHHDLSIIKALKQLKGQHVNLAVAFAEREKTALMISQTIVTLAKAGRAVKRGNLQAAARELGVSTRKKKFNSSSVPNRWLELQYGWLPLLGDAHGAAQAVSEADQSDPTKYRISVKGFSKSSRTDGNFRDSYYASIKEFSKKSIRSSTRLDYTPSDLPGLAQAAALGLTNPFDVAWELVPFSFLVDYFTPIGSILNVLDAALPYDFLGGYTADITENNSIGVIAGYDASGIVGYSFQHSKSYSYDRTCYGVSPHPNVVWFNPPESDTRKSKVVANALSLLASVFK